MTVMSVPSGVPSPAPTAGGKRCLLISISDYEQDECLQGAKDDKKASKARMELLGFEVICPESDNTEGRLRLEDLRAAVRGFLAAVESDASQAGGKAVAAVVIACHALQTPRADKNFLLPILLTSEWPRDTSGKSVADRSLADSFSVADELMEPLLKINSQTSLDVLFVFDCCRMSLLQFPPEVRAPTVFPGQRHNFYMIFACDPGRKSRDKAGLIQQVMYFLQFRLPLTEVLTRAAREVLVCQINNNVVAQRPWVELRPGLEDLTLGTEEPPLLDIPPPLAPKLAVVLVGSQADALGKILCDGSEISSCRQVEVCDTKLGESTCRIVSGLRVESARQPLLDTLADMFPMGIDVFLLVLGESSANDMRTFESLCDVVGSDVRQHTVVASPTGCTQTPGTFCRELIVDLSQPQGTIKATKVVLTCLNQLVNSKQPYTNQSFKDACWRRQTLQVLEPMLRRSLSSADLGQLSEILGSVDSGRMASWDGIDAAMKLRQEALVPVLIDAGTQTPPPECEIHSRLVYCAPVVAFLIFVLVIGSLVFSEWEDVHETGKGWPPAGPPPHVGAHKSCNHIFRRLVFGSFRQLVSGGLLIFFGCRLWTQTNSRMLKWIVAYYGVSFLRHHTQTGVMVCNCRPALFPEYSRVFECADVLVTCGSSVCILLFNRLVLVALQDTGKEITFWPWMAWGMLGSLVLAAAMHADVLNHNMVVKISLVVFQLLPWLIFSTHAMMMLVGTYKGLERWFKRVPNPPPRWELALPKWRVGLGVAVICCWAGLDLTILCPSIVVLYDVLALALVWFWPDRRELPEALWCFLAEDSSPAKQEVASRELRRISTLTEVSEDLKLNSRVLDALHEVRQFWQKVTSLLPTGEEGSLSRSTSISRSTSSSSSSVTRSASTSTSTTSRSLRLRPQPLDGQENTTDYDEEQACGLLGGRCQGLLPKESPRLLRRLLL